MKKNSILILFTIITLNLYSQTEKIYEFAKAYSTIRYFYPDPSLKKNMKWNDYLVYSANKILNKDFNLENEIKNIAPKAYFSKDSLLNNENISKSDLKNHHYWQHYGGLVAQPYGVHLDVIRSEIIGYFDKYNSKIRDEVNLKNYKNSKLRISFWAKFQTNKSDSAMFLLNAISLPKYIKERSFSNKQFIYASNEWKYYEHEIIFCKNCSKEFSSYIDIVRSNNDTLLIDDLKITNIDSNKVIYSNSFESYDSVYQRFEGLNYFSFSKNMADYSFDAKEGKYSLKLLN